MIYLKQLLFETENYRGIHQAPDRTNGAPLHNVTAIYPDDIYSSNAARYYGDGEPSIDPTSIHIIQSARNRPNAQIRIYRAVPSILTLKDKIKDLEQQKAYILKHGKIPPYVTTRLDRSSYFEMISNQLNKLKSSPETHPSIKINRGDWVSINRRYAEMHGESNLLNRYKILSATVPAKSLFTTGDSIHEWGYDP